MNNVNLNIPKKNLYNVNTTSKNDQNFSGIQKNFILAIMEGDISKIESIASQCNKSSIYSKSTHSTKFDIHQEAKNCALLKTEGEWINKKWEVILKSHFDGDENEIQTQIDKLMEDFSEHFPKAFPLMEKKGVSAYPWLYQGLNKYKADTDLKFEILDSEKQVIDTIIFPCHSSILKYTLTALENTTITIEAETAPAVKRMIAYLQKLDAQELACKDVKEAKKVHQLCQQLGINGCADAIFAGCIAKSKLEQFEIAYFTNNQFQLSQATRKLFELALQSSTNKEWIKSFLEKYPSTLKKLDLSQLPFTYSTLDLLDTFKDSIEDLNLSHCIFSPDLKFDLLGNCSKLKKLNLSYTQNTDKSLFESLLKLPELIDLNLQSCTEVKDIHLQMIGDLTQLQSLNLNGCSNITDTGLIYLKNLIQLHTLGLAECKKLALKGLEPIAKYLDIQNLNLGGWSWLTDQSIKQLEKWTSLTQLNLTGCCKLTPAAWETLKKLKLLKTLEIAHCSLLISKGIQPIETLNALTHLNLVGCKTLKDLKSIGKLTQLITLYLSSCPNLTTLDGLEKLINLQSIDLSYSEGLTDKALEIAPKWLYLKHLDLAGCRWITDIGFSYVVKLVNLETLNINECHQITDTSFDNLKNLKKLIHFSISDSDCNLSVLKNLTLLGSLSIESSPIDDETLQLLEKCTKLKSVTLKNCPKLSDKALKSIAKWVRLIHLTIAGCAITDKGVEELSILGALCQLNLNDCEKLTDQIMKTLCKFKKLQKLSLQNCELLTDLIIEPLLDFSQLTLLNLKGCELITEKGFSLLSKILETTQIIISFSHCTTIGKGLEAELELAMNPDLQGTQSIKWQPTDVKQAKSFTAYPWSNRRKHILKEKIKNILTNYKEIKDKKEAFPELKESGFETYPYLYDALNKYKPDCTIQINLLLENQNSENQSVDEINNAFIEKHRLRGHFFALKYHLPILKQLKHFEEYSKISTTDILSIALPSAESEQGLKYVLAYLKDLNPNHLTASNWSLANAIYDICECWQITGVNDFIFDKMDHQNLELEKRLDNACSENNQVEMEKVVLEMIKIASVSNDKTLAMIKLIERYSPALKKIELIDLEATPAILNFLTKFEGLEALHLFKCSQLTDTDFKLLRKFTHLRSLELYKAYKLTDTGFKELKNFKKLTHLNLTGCKGFTKSSLKLLEEMKDLLFLSLKGCYELTDISLKSLEKLPNLEFLDLSDCFEITDVGTKIFEKFNKLIEVDLSGCYQISDKTLFSLSKLSGLQKLNVSGCKKITNLGLKQLINMNNLIALNLTHCLLITDEGIEHLEALTQLKTLIVNGCDSVKPEALKQLTEALPSLTCQHYLYDDFVVEANLEKACLSNDQEALERIVLNLVRVRLQKHETIKSIQKMFSSKPIKKMFSRYLPPLKKLDLTGLKPSDEIIELLVYFKQMEELNLGDCSKVTEIGTLENLKELTTLQLTNCKKLSDEDLECFKKLPKLASLNLSGYKLFTNGGMRDLLKALPEIKCEYYNYQDIDLEKRLIKACKTNDQQELEKIVIGLIQEASKNTGKFTEVENLLDKYIIPLKSLNFSGSKTNNQVIELLKSLTCLENLELGDFYEVTEILTIENLTELTSLSLHYFDKLTDTRLKSLEKLTKLTSLNLYHCDKLTDTGLKSVEKLTKLTSLNLSYFHELTDTGLKSVEKLTKLTSLYLCNSYKLTDTGIKILKQNLPKAKISIIK